VTLLYDVRLDGAQIRCTITSDTPLTTPVFCFSLMVTPVVVSGGEMLTTLGGYGEVALPDLRADVPHEVVLRYAGAEFRPVNRAWLPLGPYLRHAGGVTELPFDNEGLRAAPHPPVTAIGAGELGLLPPPAIWQSKGGRIALPQGLCCDNPEFATVTDLAARAAPAICFSSPNGIPVTVTKDEMLAPEAYTLTIAPDEITVASSGAASTFYAAITLLNLLIVHDGHLPLGRIEDAPRFGWRGQHLDCARHFYAAETITDLLDLLALLKLNRFHWHFADDEAFRLEIDCYPELWQKTALRGDGRLIPGVFGGGISSGGTYSKDTARAIIAHAQSLHIEVLPEIEVPAHALAMNRAIDGLRDPEDTGLEASVQAYTHNTTNPAMPKMWEVTTTIALEIAELFPFDHLHIGGDELPHDTWGGSPRIGALKRREGLATTDDVQGWTMARLAASLRDQGVTPAAWEEAARGCQGGIGHDAILFSWTGQGPGIAAARAGYRVVMCPAQNVYLEMAHTGDADDWGASWAAFVALEDTLDWSPVPVGAEDISDQVIGVEGAYWSEFTTQDAQIWPMLLPRIFGVASKAWDSADSQTGADLRRSVGRYAATLGARWGWHNGA